MGSFKEPTCADSKSRVVEHIGGRCDERPLQLRPFYTRTGTRRLRVRVTAVYVVACDPIKLRVG